jgi:hypothetical protein
MNARDFEKKLFTLMFRSSEKLTPHFVAYQLDIPFEEAQRQLDQLTVSGALRLELDENGGLWYEAPGVQRPTIVAPMTQPALERPRMLAAPSRVNGLSLVALLVGGVLLLKFLVPLLIILGAFSWIGYHVNRKMNRHSFSRRVIPWYYRR